MFDFKSLFSRTAPSKQVVIQPNAVKQAPGWTPDADKSSARLSQPTPGNCAGQDGYLQAYADSSWVYACVSRIAQDAASLPLRLYKRVGKDNVLQEKHAVLDLMTRINNGMTLYDWLEWVFSSMDLSGNSYNLVSLKGADSMILPYVPSMIEPVPSEDPKIMIQAYRYHVNGQVKTIDREAMLHLKYYSSLKSGYVLGMSPLTAARLAYETDARALEWNVNKLKKGNAVEGVLMTDNPYFNDKAHRDEAMAAWKAKYTGEAGDHIATLFGGMKFEPLGISPKDMEFLNQRKMTREEILAVFRVPPAVLGLFEYANYANAEQQEAFYWRNGVLPRLRKVEGGLTERFLPMFKGTTTDMFFKFDTSGVKVLQENQDAKAKLAQVYFNMGVPYNDIAKVLDLPVKDIEGGDIGYLPFSLTPAGQPKEPAPVVDPNKDGKAAPSVSRKLTEDQKAAKWTAFIKVADKFEGRVKTSVQKYFRRQELDVQAALLAQKSLRGAQKKIKIDDVLPDPEDAAEKLAKELAALYAQIIAAQARIEIDAFQFGIDFDLTNPRVAAWINKHGLDAATVINDTTRDSLRTALASGVEAGEGIPELADRISAVYDIATGSRSVLIARTETIAASNQGALETYKQTGLSIKKGWLAALDERTRETHVEAGKEYGDAGAIPMDADFYVGDGHGAAPGQIGLPGEDCNCRCSIYPVIEE